MSSIHERPSAWFGIARRLPDGSVATPQAPGITTKISPTAREVKDFQDGLVSGEIVPLFQRIKTVERDSKPEEIHKQALIAESEATRSVLERLLNEGNLSKVFPEEKKEEKKE